MTDNTDNADNADENQLDPLKLEKMMKRQAESQRDLHGLSDRMSDVERIEWIKTNVLALTDELHEALNEMGWKPWAASRHIYGEALKGELIDAWHFMMNLFDLAGMNASEVYIRYNLKRDLNDSRQENGYDGVTSKCSDCGRALDDPAVECTAEICSRW